MFDHTFIDNHADKTCFLLHGTGGSKNDFLFLDKHLRGKYNLVGLQGNIDEQGMARFFKRLEMGVFDQDSIKEEADELHTFVEEWVETYDVSVNELVFLGYSNGANMLLATLFYHPQLIRNLVLLHPMLPFTPEPNSLDLSHHEVFITTGKHDPMVSPSEQSDLVELLKSCGAKVTLKEYQAGHEITSQEIEDVIFSLNEKVT